MKFDNYFKFAIKVCLKNAKISSVDEVGQSLWFDLLDYLYEIMIEITSIKDKASNKSEDDEKKKICKMLTELINNAIKDVLNNMKTYVSFPVIMTRLSDKHGELEIESFKEMFISMLSSYFYNEKILETASMIIRNDVAFQFKSLSQMRSKAFQINKSLCAKCDKKVKEKDEEEMVIFQCGHIYHGHCFKDSITCYACSYKEISKLLYNLIEAESLDQLMKKNVKNEDNEQEDSKGEEKGEDSAQQKADPSQKTAVKGIKEIGRAHV